MDHPFQIGQVYSNRRGNYEVVHLDNKQGTMVIRYTDDGEEAESKIPTQARIWQNMAWEEQESVRRDAAANARHQHGYGEDFTGLTASDFKTNTEGTTWRSRRGLAGQVARLLSVDTEYTFVSWAIYRWPVSFLTHREDYYMAAFETGACKTKFTIELDEQNAYFGFCIEKGFEVPEPLDNKWDWLRLSAAWKNKSSLQDTITRLEANHQVRFLARATQSTKTSHFASDFPAGMYSLWDEQNPTALSVADRWQKLLRVPPNEWIDLYLIARIPKAEAISAGVQLAHTMARVMREMLPVYAAATRE